MFATQQEIFEWLSLDTQNVDRFLRSINNILKNNIVLVVNDEESHAITAFRSFRKNKRIRR